MRKQINGQISLFDYISSEGINDTDSIDNVFSGSSDHDGLETDQRSENSEVISLFKECMNCWCSTCRHNTKGKAVPRDFAGEKKPCPSCDFCINQNKAEICEIGSYENGCKLRAEEEGIAP